MAKLVIMLRVKDALFYIKEWLARYEQLADEIVVVDNGSTDGTCAILSAHPKVVSVGHTHGFNEGRDKNLLYSLAKDRKPDWCLWIDVDEIFEPGITRAHFDRLMRSKYVDRYAFRRYHFIDRTRIAASWYWLNYSSGHDRIMWREKPGGYFPHTVLDSTNIRGINGIKAYSNFRIKHIGYINKELVDRKADIYRSVDPDKEGIIKTMYVADERSMVWCDDRKSGKVLLLNSLMTCIQLTHLYFKALKLLSGVFHNEKLTAKPDAPKAKSTNKLKSVAH